MSGSVGGIYFNRGDNASPVAYTRICEVFSISGVGEEHALIDATTFCSGGSKEYIAGLSDGQEITIELNYETKNANVDQLIADFKAAVVRSYTVTSETTSPHETFAFDALPRKWELKPSVDNKNIAAFTFKISGGITLS